MGKTSDSYLKQELYNYLQRINRMTSIEWVELKDVPNSARLPVDELKKKEAELILKNLSGRSFSVLLDERGKEMTSRELSRFFDKIKVEGTSEIFFVIAGAYGADEKVKKIVSMQLSLSKMTFTHQMIRLLFLEQIYRALAISRGLPYHHD
jgi:23S rRNA (pseudouridine1915-N3)-methyltransferase